MASEWDWRQFATGGATRPDSFSGMDPRFSSALQQMFAAAPPNIQSELRVSSGYRSPERQAQLYDAALAKYGSTEVARRWVAPPGHSNHNHGYAADLKYLSPDAMQWARSNADQFGLTFPLSNENWHVELAGVRGGNGSAPQPPTTMAATTPSMPAGAVPSDLTQQAMALMPGGASAGATGAPQAAPSMLQNLASMFIQTQQAQQQQRQDEQAAEDARRVALLTSGVAGLYS